MKISSCYNVLFFESAAPLKEFIRTYDLNTVHHYTGALAEVYIVEDANHNRMDLSIPKDASVLDTLAIRINVDDIDEAVKELSQKEYTLLQGIFEDDVTKSALMRDPLGNPLLVCQHKKRVESKPAAPRREERDEMYRQILREELIPAMGCTEPIAIALAAAKAREILGQIPTSVEVDASGSIIKNVKSVIVPHTDHMRGIGAAAAVGIIGGKAEKLLNCLSEVTGEQQEQMREYLQNTPIRTGHTNDNKVFDIIVTVRCEDHYARVRIVDYHTNIVFMEKDGEVLLDLPICDTPKTGGIDRNCLNVNDIWDFINTSDWRELKPILDPMIEHNMAISAEGLKNPYGANIGKSLISLYGDDIKIRARAAAAAGSDARMNGCEMPVIINSGSGNQGITTSVPVITYARELKVSDEKLYRALALSNLITIHQKSEIGTLSAYCGAVSAGIGAGCGIAYLLGSDLEGVKHTIINGAVTASGIICDGAKASCAAKISIAVEAGINGYYRHLGGNDFLPGDGIVGEDVEDTINNIGDLASEGMKLTNETIIDIMIQE